MKTVSASQGRQDLKDADSVGTKAWLILPVVEFCPGKEQSNDKAKWIMEIISYNYYFDFAISYYCSGMVYLIS